MIRYCIIAISLFSPLEKGRCPSFVKLESHSPKDALCKSLTKIGSVVPEKKPDFKILFMNFNYFVIMCGAEEEGVFFNFVHVYFSPLGKERSPSFVQT